MADGTEITGVAELSASFRGLQDDMKRRTGARMVVAGGQALKANAKSIIRAKGLVKSGALIKNVAIKREPSAGPDTVQYNLGVRHGRALTKKQKAKIKLEVNNKGRIVRRYEDDPYYYRFPELGTKHQPKTSYLAEALDTGRQGAIDAMQARLDADLAKVQTS